MRHMALDWFIIRRPLYLRQAQGSDLKAPPEVTMLLRWESETRYYIAHA